MRLSLIVLTHNTSDSVYVWSFTQCGEIVSEGAVLYFQIHLRFHEKHIF